MNLTEELKDPLRNKSTKEKQYMLQMQFKGTIRVIASGSYRSIISKAGLLIAPVYA